MNPVLVFYLFVAAFVLWALIAWIYPKIGGFFKGYYKEMKDIIEDKEEENEDE